MYVCIYMYVLLQFHTGVVIKKIFEHTLKAQILSIPFDTIWWILRNP